MRILRLSALFLYQKENTMVLYIERMNNKERKGNMDTTNTDSRFLDPRLSPEVPSQNDQQHSTWSLHTGSSTS